MAEIGVENKEGRERATGAMEPPGADRKGRAELLEWCWHTGNTALKREKRGLRGESGGRRGCYIKLAT